MKWLEARRYRRGYDWAAGEMLNASTEEQLACLSGHSDFAEGAMDALRAFLDPRSDKTQGHRVYDKVWVMRNNSPAKMVIYGVSEEMNLMKTGTDLYYLLAASKVGATCRECHKTVTVYATRAELIATL